MEILYKSTCITCKRTLSEIERLKLDVNSRDFFKDPLTEIELKKIVKLTGLKPNELIRKRDKMYKELNFENKKFSDGQIIKLMVKHPGLLQRPIIITKNKAYVGKLDANQLKKI